MATGNRGSKSVRDGGCNRRSHGARDDRLLIGNRCKPRLRLDTLMSPACKSLLLRYRPGHRSPHWSRQSIQFILHAPPHVLGHQPSARPSENEPWLARLLSVGKSEFPRTTCTSSFFGVADRKHRGAFSVLLPIPRRRHTPRLALFGALPRSRRDTCRVYILHLGRDEYLGKFVRCISMSWCTSSRTLRGLIPNNPQTAIVRMEPSQRPASKRKL
jgi:hypothetical protein